MKTLTRAEEQIMQILWDLKAAFVKDIIAEMPAPKPHYNTVSTLIKILVDKGFVGYKELGKSYQYYPLILKDEYSKKTLRTFLKGYFEGSFSNMVSFFVKEKDISVNELEQLLQQIRQNKKPGKK
jgi:BlaI family transcriptional regulator, penicillinase repressor